ncbi:MAG: hypothetical protein HZA54_18020 [Planctomycetes bacterium]|nr:hypothetical protein [Planctomycetota bacterium]
MRPPQLPVRTPRPASGRRGRTALLAAGALLAWAVGCLRAGAADSGWVTVAAVAENRRVTVVLAVPRVTTDRLRVVITRPSWRAGADCARLGEIELFGPIGKLAIAAVTADSTIEGYEVADLTDGDRRFAEGDAGRRGWASVRAPAGRPRTLEIALAAAAEIDEILLAGAAPELDRLAAFEISAPRRAVDAARAPAPEPPLPRREPLGEFAPSFYWTAHEEDFRGAAEAVVLLADGSELGRFPESFARALRLEGSGRLRDGRVVNVAGAAGRFAVVDAAYGMGVQGFHLIPFRSLAVDRAVLPIGTRLYLPATRGVELPDGTRHDGIWYAHDVGSAIKGRRLDLFIGRKAVQGAWEKGGVKHLAPLAVYRVKD